MLSENDRSLRRECFLSKIFSDLPESKQLFKQLAIARAPVMSMGLHVDLSCEINLKNGSASCFFPCVEVEWFIQLKDTGVVMI